MECQWFLELLFMIAGSKNEEPYVQMSKS